MKNSLDSLLNELPVAFQYQENSNNAKLLTPFADGIDDLGILLDRIHDWRDIDQAEGKALDRIGNDYGVYRNEGDDDQFYRYRIKMARGQATSDGTFDDLIKILSNALNIDKSKVDIRNAEDEPDAIKIKRIPSYVLKFPKQKTVVADTIQKSVAAGIRVANVEFETDVQLNLYFGGFTSKHIKRVSQLDTSAVSTPGKIKLGGVLVENNNYMI